MLTTIINAGPVDTGFIEWTQPNGVKFIARVYGDEFIHWMETEDGYQIIMDGDGYYYYAKLGNNGDFKPSNEKVGIDSPRNKSKYLKRKENRYQELENERIAYNQAIADRQTNIVETLSTTTQIDIAVVLIDFTPNANGNQNGPYERDLFNKKFFSVNQWIGDYVHPENDKLFGSLKDYYNEQTNGRIEIKGKNGTQQIINRADPSNPLYPDWIELPNDFLYYWDLNNYDQWTILELFYDTAVMEYPELSNYDNIIFVHAGEQTLSGSFWPHSYSITSRGSRDMALVGEQDFGKFSHIGTVTHEFGHQLGMSDQYTVTPPKPDRNSLMCHGGSNGPGRNGACPAPISPIYKISKGWVVPTIINTDSYGVEIHYTYPNPSIYQVNIPGSDEYFVLEEKRREGFNQYTPSWVYSDDIGVYIWHADLTPGQHYRLEELEYADNSDDNDQNPFPTTAGGKANFTDNTIPSSNKRDGTASNIWFQNIENVGKDASNSYVKLDVINPPPGAPQNLRVVWYNGHPKLTWDTNLEDDISSYKIWKYAVGSSMIVATVTHNSSNSTHSWIDYDVSPAGKIDPVFTYSYKVKAVDNSNQESSYSNQVSISGTGAIWKIGSEGNENNISTYKLFSNFPNPFNPSTQIEFQIPKDGFVNLTVYNSLGQKITELVNSNLSIGKYNVEFNADNLPSGLYIYKLQAGEFSSVKKMMLTK